MKISDLLIIGGLAIGAYFLYRMFSSSTTNGGTGGGGGTGEILATLPLLPPPSTKSPTPTPATPVLPVPRGAVITQRYNPSVSANSPLNTVITAPMKHGGITVITAPSPAQTWKGAPYVYPKAQPPLNIRDVFGSVVIPRVVRGIKPPAPNIVSVLERSGAGKQILARAGVR